MPESRARKLSAVRSAASCARAGPAIRSKDAPAGAALPSARARSQTSAGSTSSNAASASARPHTTSGARASITASQRASLESTAALVASPVPTSSASARSRSGSQLARGGTGVTPRLYDLRSPSALCARPVLRQAACDVRLGGHAAGGTTGPARLLLFSLELPDLLADQRLGEARDHVPRHLLD